MNRYMADQIPAVKEHHELEADHLSFLTGSNMDLILDITDNVLNEFNPIDDKSEVEEYNGSGWIDEMDHKDIGDS